MLNRVSIEAAMPVAQLLNEKGVRILPKENTPMMSLLLATDRAALDLSLAENCDVIGLLGQRSQNPAHQVAMADLVDLASKAVGRTLDNARNVVLPHIRELVEQVSVAVQGRRISAISPYEIVMKEVPAVYSNQGIFNMAKRYGVSDLSYPVPRLLAALTIDDVVALAKTGMDGVDSELSALLSIGNNEGYATLLDVFNGRKAFGDIDFDYAAGVLVVAQNLYDEPREGVAMGLNDYNTAVNAVIHAAAAMVLSKIESYKRTRELGQLYVPNQRSITQVVVMGEAYRKLLDAGLSPEALLGNEMAGRRYSAGQLIENKSALEQIYNREMNLRSLKTQTEMFGITRSVIDVVIRSEIAKAGEDVNKALLLERLKTAIDKLDERNSTDLYQVLTDVVCNVFYLESDARSVIMIINTVGAQFGAEADPREVALLATIKYVNNWIANQLVICAA